MLSKELRCLNILGYGESNSLISTATYISRDFLRLIWKKAVNQFLEDNQNRLINLTQENVSESDITTGPLGTSEWRA